MKKVFILAGVISTCLFVSACSAGHESGTGSMKHVEEAVQGAEQMADTFFNTSTSYFDDYETKWEGETYRASGTVHIAKDDNTEILSVELDADREIRITGSFKRSEGEMQLVYKGTDGKITVIAESEPGGEDETKIDLPVTLKAGAGQFKLLGKNSVFAFDLTFSGLIEGTKVNGVSEKAHEAAKEMVKDTASGVYEGTYSDVTDPVVLMEAELKEAEPVNVSARIHVRSHGSGKMTLGTFKLMYETSDGQEIVIIDHDSIEEAGGGYEWKDKFNKEAVLPAGKTKLVLTGIEGENYKIELKVSVK